MKKVLTFVLVCAVGLTLCGRQACAQTVEQTSSVRDSVEVRGERAPRYAVRMEIGGAPFVSGLVTSVAGGIRIGHGYSMRDNHISDLYKDYYGALYTSGNVGAEFDFILKKWLIVSAGVSFTGFWGDKYDGYTQELKGKESGVAANVLCTARFTYFNRRMVQLYSGLAVGGGLLFDNSGFDTYMVHFQGIPFGVAFGSRVFGFAELGIGTMYVGANVGLGYRF